MSNYRRNAEDHVCYHLLSYHIFHVNVRDEIEALEELYFVEHKSTSVPYINYEKVEVE